MEGIEILAGHIECRAETTFADLEPGPTLSRTVAPGPGVDGVGSPVTQQLAGLGVVQILQIRSEIRNEATSPLEDSTGVLGQLVDRQGLAKAVVIQERFEQHGFEAAGHSRALDLAEEIGLPLKAASLLRVEIVLILQQGEPLTVEASQFRNVRSAAVKLGEGRTATERFPQSLIVGCRLKEA